ADQHHPHCCAPAGKLKNSPACKRVRTPANKHFHILLMRRHWIRDQKTEKNTFKLFISVPGGVIMRGSAAVTVLHAIL
ncbi:hypothetical protein IRJ41_020713, partial [Triplophysa rosa]